MYGHQCSGLADDLSSIFTNLDTSLGISYFWRQIYFHRIRYLFAYSYRYFYLWNNIFVCRCNYTYCSGTVWEPRILDFIWHCFSSNFVYNFNKTPLFPLMWMVRFVTFVHKDLFPDTNPCEQKWQIWPSTSTGTLSLIHIWRCRRSYACRSRWSPYH